MIKVVLIAVIVLGVAVAGLVVWGTRLPVAHVATRSILVPAAPADVFAVIGDHVNAPSWRSKLNRVEVTTSGSNGLPRFTEVSGGDRLTMEIVETVAPERLVTRIVDNSAFGGAWAYRISPEGAGSRVTITEHGEVYNPFFRVISAKVIGHTATLDGYLTDLGRKFATADSVEAGETVPLGAGRN